MPSILPDPPHPVPFLFTLIILILTILMQKMGFGCMIPPYMRRLFLPALCCYSCLLFSAESLNHAQSLFDDALYPEAAVVYQNVLSRKELDPELAPQIRYQLALSHFHNQDYKEVIETLNGGPLSTEDLYLLALTYKHLHQDVLAVDYLNQYLQASGQKHLPEALLELAIAHFQLGHLVQARELFEQQKGERLSTAAKIYLARIDIAEEKYRHAEKILSTLETSIPHDQPLHYEVSYLQGQLFFQRQDYQKALSFFEKAIPNRNPEQASWYPEALYQLGWTHLKLGENLRLASHFDKAEACFQLHHRLTSEESSLLALAQSYIIRGQRLSQDESVQKAKDLLIKTTLFSTDRSQIQSLLLNTEAATSYQEREKLYRQLTQDSQSDKSLYALAWYLRGLNDFQEGSQRPQGRGILDRATFALRKSFDLLKDHDALRAGLALRYQAQAYLLQKNEEARLNAFETLKLLMSQPEAILSAMSDLDEVYYLTGLTASQLSIGAEKESMALQAKHYLEQQLYLFPEGKFASEGLYLLGTLAFQQKDYPQAKQLFLRLTHDYSSSPLVGSSYFWAAKSTEMLKGEKEEIQKFRQQVFEKYPDSPYAAEAYFFYYTYSDYIQGNQEAMHHLQTMSDKFPNSPYLLNAHYLLGFDYKRNRKSQEGKIIHKRNLIAAIEAFHRVETDSDRLLEKNLIPKEEHEYFVNLRYRARLEKALVNMAIADESKGAKRQIYLEYAADLFREINRDIDKTNDPVLQQSIAVEAYLPIQEESDYGLAQSYLKANKDGEAEKIFDKMLEKYQAAKITRGYFLSRIWYEKGMIASRRNEIPEALHCLANAEDTGKGKILNTEEKLGLWIQQGLFLKEINQMDNAMLVLSKVINEDVASGQRLKAMVLRAEIYQKQGRHDLARKQLEATAKKGGEWALKAQEKLEQEYGYQ